MYYIKPIAGPNEEKAIAHHLWSNQQQRENEAMDTTNLYFVNEDAPTRPQTYFDTQAGKLHFTQVRAQPEPLYTDGRNVVLDQKAQRSQARNSNNSQFSWNSPIESEFLSMFRQDAQTLAADPVFRKVAKISFLRKPSTLKTYRGKLKKLFEFLEIPFDKNMECQKIFDLIQSSKISSSQIEEWMFLQFFSKDLSWSTIEGYLASVKTFFHSFLPAYFCQEGEFDQTRRFFKHFFRNTSERKILIEFAYLKDFFKFWESHIISQIDMYCFYVCALGTLLCLRKSDLNRICFSKTRIILQDRSVSGYFQISIKGAKNAKVSETQTIFFPLTSEDSPVYLSPHLCWSHINNWRRSNIVFGNNLFKLPKKFKFNMKSHNERILLKFQDWKRQLPLPVQNLPFSLSQDFLRKCMISIAVNEFSLRPEELLPLTRHKSTQVLYRNYLSHNSVRQNTSFANKLQEDII